MSSAATRPIEVTNSAWFVSSMAANLTMVVLIAVDSGMTIGVAIFVWGLVAMASSLALCRLAGYGWPGPLSRLSSRTEYVAGVLAFVAWLAFLPALVAVADLDVSSALGSQEGVAILVWSSVGYYFADAAGLVAGRIAAQLKGSRTDSRGGRRRLPS